MRNKPESVIYVLCDNVGHVRYVGKVTRMTLSGRLSKHLSDARKGIINHRCNWIRSMMESGFIPTIRKIDSVSGDGCQREIEWIRYFKMIGVDLVNGTLGGEGSLGRSATDKTKSAVSLAHKGKPLSEEHKKKIGLAGKGRVIPEEQRIKISEARKNSAPAKAHAISQKGRVFSDETRRKIREGVRAYFNRKTNNQPGAGISTVLAPNPFPKVYKKDS